MDWNREALRRGGPHYSRVIFSVIFALNRVISALSGVDLTPAAGARADDPSRNVCGHELEVLAHDVAVVLVPGWQSEKHPQAARSSRTFQLSFA